MKKKKIIILFLIVFLVCGCNVDYNLTINKDNISETATFYLDKTAKNKEIFDKNSKLNETSNYGEEEILNYYSVKTRETNNYYQLDYKYKYTHIKNDVNVMEKRKNLKEYSYLSQCYSNPNFEEDNTYITIDTDKKFNCLYNNIKPGIDSVTINIKTNLKVVDNNADKVNGNTYIWNINKSNYQNKPVFIKIDKVSNYNFNSKLVFFFSIVLVVLLIVFIVLFLKHKQNKINKF